MLTQGPAQSLPRPSLRASVPALARRGVLDVVDANDKMLRAYLASDPRVSGLPSLPTRPYAGAPPGGSAG